MKLYKLFMVVFLITIFFKGGVEAQQIDFELRYNDGTNLYEVFATPDSSNALYFVGGGSQLSIVLPQDLEDVSLEINSIAGGLWTDNSRVFKPESAHFYDFHGIATNGAMVHFVEGEPLLMFTFELPGGVCRSDVRLFENAEDHDSRAAGMNGSDFRNFFANVFEPLKNNWLSNENIMNETCAHAPSVAPNSIRTQENVSVTLCMPIDDPNVGDSFEAVFCANVAQSVNSVSNITISGNELCLEYNPLEGFVGAESVCIEVCDNSGLCNTSMVSIIVEPEPEYASFSAAADQCNNVLDWTIYSPSDFVNFELERSEDGVDYRSLGVFESNDQLENMVFTFVDEDVKVDYFYRLKLVFTDGAHKYSETLFVNTICDGEDGISHATITAAANSCENFINWAISNPVAFSYYELERSVDGDEFEMLDLYEVNTEVSTLSSYYTDEETTGDHHYRLKLVYTDGREEYSNQVFVESNCDIDGGFLLYPNPIIHSSSILNVKFISETEKVNVVITDPIGRVLRQLKLDVELGMNTLRLDVIDLAVGTYFIAIESKEEITKSFVKIDERF